MPKVLAGIFLFSPTGTTAQQVEGASKVPQLLASFLVQTWSISLSQQPFSLEQVVLAVANKFSAEFWGEKCADNKKAPAATINPPPSVSPSAQREWRLKNPAMPPPQSFRAFFGGGGRVMIFVVHGGKFDFFYSNDLRRNEQVFLGEGGNFLSKFFEQKQP